MSTNDNKVDTEMQNKESVMTAATDSSLPTASLGKGVPADVLQKEVAEARKNLNVSDTNSIVVFGAAAQAPLTKLADTMLDSIKARDAGEVGEQLTAMVTAMKSIDLDALGGNKKQSFISRMLGRVNPIEKFRERFDSVSDLIARTEIDLNKHAMMIMRDNNFLDEQRKAAKEALVSLEVNIIALDEEIADYSKHVDELQETFNKTNDFMDAQYVNEGKEILDRLEQRRIDLMLTRQVIATLFSKNSIIKTTNITLLNKIQNQIANGLPLWKSEISQRIMNGNRISAATALKESTDFTNELFKQSARDLRLSNKMVREEANRGIIEIDTIKEMSSNLIGVMTDTIKIVDDGRKARKEVEDSLREEASKLKEALISTTKEAASSSNNSYETSKNAFLDYKK